MMLLHLPIVIMTALPLSPVADTLPKFDIARECRSESSPEISIDQCSEEEQHARQQLQAEWTQFAAANRTTCEREAQMDGTGSYVELLTCLEMTRDSTSEPR